MTKRKTRIGYLMDESFSMHGQTEAVKDAFAEYVNGMKGLKRTKLSAYAFTTALGGSDMRFTVLYEKTKPEKIELPVKYSPHASTPLYDAIAETIRRMELQVDKDTDVLIVIHTDGQENCSQEMTQENIQKLVERKTADGWNFQFVAEDMSKAVANMYAAHIGIPSVNVMNVNSANRGVAAGAMAAAHTTYSTSVHTGKGRKTMSVEKMYEDAGTDKDANA